jgi:hypothetical protein
MQLTPEEKRIVRALRKYRNATGVARKLKVSRHKVWKLSRRAKIELTEGHAAKGNPEFSPKECARILEVFAANPHPGPAAKLLTEEFRRPVNRWAVAYQARKHGLLPPLGSGKHKRGRFEDVGGAVETPKPIRERSPDEFREEQRAVTGSEKERDRRYWPSAPGQSWKQNADRSSSVASTLYPRQKYG